MPGGKCWNTYSSYFANIVKSHKFTCYFFFFLATSRIASLALNSITQLMDVYTAETAYLDQFLT